MSKLSNSLRQSISAEKESVAKQAPIEISYIDAVSRIKASPIKSVSVETKREEISPDEYALLDSLRTKLMNKNVPAIHHYEIMRILNELNLLNKNADYVTNSTNKAINLANNILQKSISNLDEATRLNLEVVKTILNSSGDIFRAMNPIMYWLNAQNSTAMINKFFGK